MSSKRKTTIQKPQIFNMVNKMNRATKQVNIANKPTAKKQSNKAKSLSPSKTKSSPKVATKEKVKKYFIGYTELYELLKHQYSTRLSWDVCNSMIRLDDQSCKFEDIRYKIEKERDIICSKEDLRNLTQQTALNNPYNPIADYLDTVCAKYSEQACQDVIVNVAKNILGLQNEIEITYFVKFLVGAVARAKQAGCKVDTSLILQGSQGIGKTTFFQALAGNFFYTLSHNTRDSQALKEQYKYWIIEWGEFGAKLTPSKIESLKNEMSKTKDEIKHLYVNESETRLRHFVFVGTTNKEQFLIDESGNRRFWVVKVEKPIDTNYIKDNCDLIWASAVKLYQEGYQWYLDENEQALSSQLNSSYEVGDVWEPIISTWINNQAEQFTTSDVLTIALGILKGKLNRSHELRVSKILRNVGYEKKRVRTKELPDGYYWSKM